MDIQQIVANLEALSGPDRKADGAIAKLAGYEFSVENGANVWKRDGIATRLPTFTGSVDRAIEFLKFAVPDSAGAIAWEGNRWRAKINEDGDIYHAATPELAICLATLGYIKKTA